MVCTKLAFAGLVALAAAAVPAPYPYPTTSEVPAYPEETKPAYEEPPVYKPTTEAYPPAYPTSTYEQPPVYKPTTEAYPPKYPTTSEEHKPEYPTETYPAKPTYGYEHPPVYTTEYITTSKYETYCPKPTTLTYNTKTYVITTATTLTVTECEHGCTVYHPVPPKTTEEVHKPTTYVGSIPPTTYAVETPKYPTGPATTPIYKPTGTGVYHPTGSKPVQYEGAATKVGAGALMGVAAIAMFL